MLEKGGFSFVALLVINPMLILLFQNCSFAPVTQAEMSPSSVESQKASVSSVGMMDRAAPGHKVRQRQPASKTVASCRQGKDLCPVPHFE